MSESESRQVNQPLAMRDPPPDADAAERRWSARKPIALDVVIYEKGLPVATAVSRNVALDGMYVETVWHLFREGTPLKAEFIVADTRGGRRYRLPVIVKHVSRRGFGVTFNIFDQKLFRAIEAMLYGFDDSAQLGSRRIGKS